MKYLQMLRRGLKPSYKKFQTCLGLPLASRVMLTSCNTKMAPKGAIFMLLFHMLVIATALIVKALEHETRIGAAEAEAIGQRSLYRHVITTLSDNIEAVSLLIQIGDIR